jgi:hypothetical protein
MEYPRTVSMSVRDDVLGCISTMTWTMDLIPDLQESCILTVSLCCLPLHWKYIFNACMHRNACKGFLREDMNAAIAYFRHDNTTEADKDERDSTASSSFFLRDNTTEADQDEKDSTASSSSCKSPSK